MKTLVVYYSLTGNTRLIAEAAARELGAEIEELRELKRRAGIKGFVCGGRDSLRKKSPFAWRSLMVMALARVPCL